MKQYILFSRLTLILRFSQCSLHFTFFSDLTFTRSDWQFRLISRTVNDGDQTGEQLLLAGVIIYYQWKFNLFELIDEYLSYPILKSVQNNSDLLDSQADQDLQVPQSEAWRLRSDCLSQLRIKWNITAPQQPWEDLLPLLTVRCLHTHLV